MLFYIIQRWFKVLSGTYVHVGHMQTPCHFTEGLEHLQSLVPAGVLEPTVHAHQETAMVPSPMKSLTHEKHLVQQHLVHS